MTIWFHDVRTVLESEHRAAHIAMALSVLDKVVLARYRVELARFKCGSVAGLGHVLWRDRARRARARAREGCAAARFSACRAMRSPAPGTCGKANRVCQETCVCDKIEGNEGDGGQEGR